MLAFNTFHLSRWFVFDGHVVALSLLMPMERGAPSGIELLEQLAAKRGPESASPLGAVKANQATLCFVPPKASPESIVASVHPFLSPDAFDQLFWWSTGWWGSGETFWWLAVQKDNQPLSLQRMDLRVRPGMQEPLCLPSERAHFEFLERDAQGVLFQVLDCKQVPSVCAAR